MLLIYEKPEVWCIPLQTQYTTTPFDQTFLIRPLHLVISQAWIFHGFICKDWKRFELFSKETLIKKVGGNKCVHTYVSIHFTNRNGALLDICEKINVMDWKAEKFIAGKTRGIPTCRQPKTRTHTSCLGWTGSEMH